MPLYEITTLAPATPSANEETLHDLLTELIARLGSEGASTEAQEDNKLADRCQSLLDRLENGEAAPKRLVEADNSAQAIRYCAGSMFDARLVRSPSEVVTLLGQGVAVEKPV